MKIIKGISASKGYAIGKIKFNKTNSFNFTKETITDTDNEIQRYEEAKQKTINYLNNLYEKALKDIGDNEAQIFQIHAIMLEDLDYNESVVNIINNEKVNAEYAVNETSKIFSNMLSDMDDEYLKERSADVVDVSVAVIKSLLGIKDLAVSHSTPYILAADQLMPSETIVLDKSKVMAILTENGSKISHSAILARTMGIPAIVNLGDKLNKINSNTKIIVDGFKGNIYIEPDEETLAEFEYKRKTYIEKREKLKQLIGKKAISKDGTEIKIYANIGNPADIKQVLENDAEGIGLFRSEYLYMEKNNFPTEEEQFKAYKQILNHMGNKHVIIRTLDIGADKNVPYLNLGKEENPALGVRAVRICLKNPNVFKTQLRALYRASVFGNLSIMVPMITSLEEILKVKKIINEVKIELKKDKIEYNSKVSLGIMIETPAAVVVSDILAKHVDFFSIGTNDLTQYTLAADRMNPNLEKVFNPRNIAVLRMIKTTVENGNKQGIWTGICGESAADLKLTEFYLSIGVKELSVSPAYVLEIREKVLDTDLQGKKKSIIDTLIKEQ